MGTHTSSSVRRPSLPRRVLGCAALGLCVSVLPSAPARAGSLGTIQIQHDRGVTVVRTDPKPHVVLNERHGVASSNGAMVATSTWRGKPGKEASKISVLDATTGEPLWTTTVVGRWRPEAINGNGTKIILGDPKISNHHAAVPGGRTSTKLVLVDRGEPARPFLLSGNFVAEAFSVDSSQAVLVEHLPPERPSSYRVRPLDLRFGSLLPQAGAVKTAQTASALEDTVMRGQRLSQVWSPTGIGLYTLYDASTYGEATAMFIHALNLGNVTATCIPVPEAIDAGIGKGTITWVNENAVVVVGAKGAATIDPRTGSTTNMVLKSRIGRPAVAADQSSLWISSGRTLEQLNLATLEPVSTYDHARRVMAISPVPYGPVLMLDSSGEIWLAGPGVDKPIRRAKLPLRLAANSVSMSL